MTNKLHFLIPTEHASGYDEHGTHDMPEGATSELMLRYVLDENGQVIDQYAGMTDEEAVAEHVRLQEAAQAAADAANQAVDLAKARTVTRLAFLMLIPEDERLAIRAEAKTDPKIEDALDLIDKAEEIYLDDPNTVRLLAYMEFRSLVSAETLASIDAFGKPVAA